MILEPSNEVFLYLIIIFVWPFLWSLKVRTISLFGEVWGIGPATALKLYDKGYRTLDDLKNDDSLTHAQKIGLKYFDDINTRIPRHEVWL